MQRPPLDPEYRPILEKVREQKLRYNPLDELLQIAMRKPRSIAGFVCHAIDAVPEMMGYWDTVLDWLPEEDWPGIIHAAVTALTNRQQPAKPKIEIDLESPDILSIAENLDTADYDAVYDVYSQIAGIGGKNMVAQSVITRAANQFPKLLHPHLKALFAYSLETQNFFGLLPFRLANVAEHDFLWDIIYDDDASASEKYEAFQGLLLSYEPKVIARVMQQVDRIDFEAAYQAAFPGWNLPSRTFDQYFNTALGRIGYAWEQSKVRNLCNSTAWHIRLAKEDYCVLSHPTWNIKHAIVNLSSQCGEHCSKKCEVCTAPIIRLLTIPEATNLPSATFCYPPKIDICFYCFQEENVYFKLDQEGNVTVKQVDYDESHMANGDFQSHSKPVVLSQLSHRWYYQDWGGGAAANLYRLGGEPSWVQGPEFPACPECNYKMNFMLQHIMNYPMPVDEHAETHSDGMTYYFWCESCRIYLARSQYT